MNLSASPKTRQFPRALKVARDIDVRVPPQDLQAEQAVLGAMILDRVALIEIQRFLKEEDFYREKYRKIFRAICGLNSKSEPVDAITLGRELKINGDLTDEMPLLITELIEQVPTAANAEYYAKIVKECAKKRWLIEKCGNALAEGYADELSSIEIAERLVDEIIAAEGISKTLEPMELATMTYTLLTDAPKSTYIPTGFEGMDRLLQGARRGVFGTVTGESETGKSTMCQNIALQMAKKGFRVAYIILEDKPERVVQRQLCIMKGWSMDRLESNDPRVLAFDDKAGAMDAWVKLGIRICGRMQVGTHWKSIKLWMIREAKRHQIDMFFIDGGERIQIQPNFGETRWDAQARMVTEIEDMAQSLDVGLWVLIGQAKTKKDRFHHTDEDEEGTNAWRKLARQRLFVAWHPDSKNEIAYENITVVKITKNSDGKKGSVWFEGERATYRWKEVRDDDR